MIFYTDSGSIYELDKENNRIRRLEGTENPTPRQGADGEWKVFKHCSEVLEGWGVLIRWEGIRSTITSPVKTIASPSNTN